MVDAVQYARAFERNCPDVRLTQDERWELQRLFFECQKDALHAPKPGGRR